MTSAWPTDPENTAPYVYAESCTGTKYCICATMERNTGVIRIQRAILVMQPKVIIAWLICNEKERIYFYRITGGNYHYGGSVCGGGGVLYDDRHQLT